MAVKLRLKRIGAKKKPFYRVIAIDDRSRRNGKEIERVGFYDPHNSSNTKLNLDLVSNLISKGAIPTETVKNLIYNLSK